MLFRSLEIPFSNNKWLIYAGIVSLGMILAVIYIAPLQGVFRTIGLGFLHMCTIIFIVVSGILVSLIVNKMMKTMGLSGGQHMSSKSYRMLNSKAFSGAVNNRMENFRASGRTNI